MMLRMRRPVMIALAAALILAACGGGGGSKATPHPPPTPSVQSPAPNPSLAANGLTAPGRENIAFDYMRIRANEDLTKFGVVSLIVAGKTAGRHSAQAI